MNRQNRELKNLYAQFTGPLLSEWQTAFPGEHVPCRVNEFGILDEENYAGILCICRETNGWSNEDYARGVLFRPWLESIAKDGLAQRGHITRYPNMWYNLSRWILLIQDPERDLKDLTALKTVEALRLAAFTNVNKVRGKSGSGKEYTSLSQMPTTQEVLRKEIELLQPEWILCGGTAEIVKPLLPLGFNGIFLDMPHPGSRKGTEVLLRKLKNQLVFPENL